MTVSSLLTWCLDHWELLLTLIINIILLIVMICKKKVKVVDVMTTVLSVLPTYIREAESNGGTGEEKFIYVANNAIDLLVELTGSGRTNVIKKYGVVIRNNIENILETPQKKGR